MSAPEAYPLHWPEGRPRTPLNKLEWGQFQVSPRVATAGLVEELRKLGARYPVISSNMPLRRDGLPYASGKEPDDPGAAVYFEYSGAQFVFACDRYDRVHKNIRAIGKTIEALRGLERWGTGEMMQRAFRGFEALPEPGKWWTVLGLTVEATAEEIEAAYRTRAKQAHPDAGGGHDAMAELNEAKTTALEALRA